ncbi:MAG: N-acetylmuramoyl-L-alanine amidase, partial [Pseudomonadota bacterium]
PEGVYYNIQGMFEDIEVDDQGKINRIRIGSKTYRGTEVRELLQLNSTRFDYIPIKFLVKCIGTGHGLGLCLCGAREMAKSGKNYREILKYYYTGVSFEKMKTPDSGKPLRGLRIVLDAAHGGENCNDNRGASGLREKDVNLDITNRLGRMLEEQGAEVHLTRIGDTSIALSDRAALSNGKRPELFLSIGQNSFPNSTASGTELYYYRGDTQGERLSRLILERLEKSLGLKDRGARTAEFYLLREVKASAVIIQLLYISNPRDEALLSDPGFREKAAEAIFEGIRKYYIELGNSCM